MSKKFEIKDNDLSDGYHTFDELYEHRCLIYINLCLHNKELCSWRPDFDGWFVLYYNSSVGQISYHVNERYLYLIKDKIQRKDDWVWDGHTSNIVVERLQQLANEAKGGEK